MVNLKTALRLCS